MLTLDRHIKNAIFLLTYLDQFGLHIMLFRIANSKALEQICPSGIFWSVSALFAMASWVTSV